MRRLGVGVAAAAVTTVCVLVGTSVHGAQTPITASRIPVTIKATTLEVGELTYAGTVEVQTAAGTVPTLELRVTDATFDGLVLDLPCVPIPRGGLTGRTTTDGLTTAPALTVYATDVLATIDGNTIRISSTDPTYPPPPAGTTLMANGTLGNPSMVALLATSGSLHAVKTRTTASFCSPTGAAGLTGGAPFALTPRPTGTPETSTPPSTAPAAPDEPASTPGTAPPEPPASSAPAEPATPAAPEPSPAEPSSPVSP